MIQTRRLDELNVSSQQIAHFCERWQITELSLFGSALRDDFRPDSDIDLLVSFVPGTVRQLDAVAADGQRFLVNTLVEEATSTPITLLVNWPALLKK